MIDPALTQAVRYAHWYLSRGESRDAVLARLSLSRDHQWMTEEQRIECVNKAASCQSVTQRFWEAYPALKPVLKHPSEYKLRVRRKKGNRGPR